MLAVNLLFTAAELLGRADLQPCRRNRGSPLFFASGLRGGGAAARRSDNPKNRWKRSRARDGRSSIRPQTTKPDAFGCRRTVRRRQGASPSGVGRDIADIPTAAAGVAGKGVRRRRARCPPPSRPVRIPQDRRCASDGGRKQGEGWTGKKGDGRRTTCRPVPQRRCSPQTSRLGPVRRSSGRSGLCSHAALRAVPAVRHRSGQRLSRRVAAPSRSARGRR